MADIRIEDLKRAQPGGIAPENLLNEMRLRLEGEFTAEDALNQIRRRLTNFRAAPGGLSGMAKETGLGLLNMIQAGRKGGGLTLSDLGTVPGVGMASAAATGVKGVGVFGGRLGKTFSQARSREFLDLERKGVSSNERFIKTGFFRGADGRIKFEIPDTDASFKPGADKAIGSLPKRAFGRRDLILDDVIDHPGLFKNYPGLKDTKITFSNGATKATGQFNPVDKSIEINVSGMDTQKIKSVLLHEVQHAVQEIETFAKGGNPDFMMQKLFDSPNQELAFSQKAVRQAYEQLAGEVEARNVQSRMDFSRNFLRILNPATTEDFPRRQQLVFKRADQDFTLGTNP